MSRRHRKEVEEEEEAYLDESSTAGEEEEEEKESLSSVPGYDDNQEILSPGELEQDLSGGSDPTTLRLMKNHVVVNHGISKPIFPPENSNDDDDPLLGDDDDDDDDDDGDDDDCEESEDDHNDDDNNDVLVFSKQQQQQQRLTRDEVQDLQEALEHIMVVGNHYRHLQWQCDREYYHRRRRSAAATRAAAAAPNSERVPAAAVAAATVAVSSRSGLEHGRVEREEEKDKSKAGNTACNQRRKRGRRDEEDDEHETRSRNDSSNLKNSRKDSSSSSSCEDGKKESVINKRKKNQKQRRFWEMIHAEDFEIYGDMESCAWPRQSSYRGIAQIKRVQKRDWNWCRIHGDDHVGDTPQNRAAFVTHRLSNQQQCPPPDSRSSAAFVNTAEQTTASDAENGNHEGNETTMTEDETETLPRSAIVQSLLQHCWERAVHAASSSIVVNVNITPKHEGSSVGVSTSSPRPPPPLPLQSAPIGAADFCRPKREALKIPCPLEKEQDSSSSSSSSTTTAIWKCPVCCVDFDSRGKLDEHFYGTNGHPQQQQPGQEEPKEQEHCSEPSPWPKLRGRRGCCWTLIERRRIALLDHVLQTEVQVQSRLLARFLMNSTIRERDNGHNATKPSRMSQVTQDYPGNIDVDGSVDMGEATNRKRHQSQSARSQEASASMFRMDRQHVHAVLSNSLTKAKQGAPVQELRHDQTSSHGSTSTKTEALLMETVLVESDMPPLVLNPAILRAVKSRCIQRYGKIA
jgi:hypothetical protein